MNPSWLFLMAWRDSRRSRARLLLFTSAIVLGIAALVGITSFGDNMARSVNEQARELVGADLVLSSSQPVDSALRPALARLGRARSEEVAFASLILFPKNQGVRLAQVRALSGGFPYYGTWETQPAGAVVAFRAARGGRESRVALVDDALLAQFNARPGDSIKVGQLTFYIAGRVLKTPGQSGFSAAVAPTVFIPGALLAQTGLVQRGSRLQYKTYFQFAPGTDVTKALAPVEARLDAAGIDTDTVAKRQQQTGRSFQDLTRYLNLVAFVALLLGCVGVASAVSLYAREKRAAVAVLRCLGASGRQAMLIYLIQTTLMGLAGAVLGAALGSVVQLALPRVFAGLLPVTVRVAVSWPAIGLGLGAGLLVALLFALLPLLSIRRVSPLRTLRASVDEETSANSDPWRWLVLALIAVFITGFAGLQTRNWQQALGFSGGLLVAFAGLALGALALMWLVRRLLPVGWSYVWRQGLANLYRPQNQTLVLTVSLGLGTFLIATLYLLQALLLGRVELSASGAQPNLVLFDIQKEQQTGVTALLTDRRLPLLQQVPVVTMRLAAINNRSVAALKKDTASGVPAWALTREYRVTYRDSLIASEKLVAGRAPYRGPGPGGLPRVSVDADYFKRVKLKLGDTLTFNVQGAPMDAVVGGTRTVDWGRVQTNFLVVFPRGVLEAAPQFHVIMTRTNTPAQLADIQRTLVTQFPNVSAIDLGLILQTLDDILSKISFVIRFMALFSIVTGLLVLSSLVILSRYQRIQESVLLRTLGASRGQILRITLVEYSLLGLLAAAAGIGLAVLATWALAAFVFEATFAPVAAPLLALAAIVTALTAALGLFNSREVLTKSPLAVLRGE
ncbi:ABC transporter permease [uncultured Hymenobacter sp.]|uniref:ABC transporter permease n=1 Tax=uncultured Hymenobacter sp. TaxID=170016 RepID=UPI0035CB09A0